MELEIGNFNVIDYIMGNDDPHKIGEITENSKVKLQWLKSKDGVYSSCQDSKIVKMLESGTYVVFQDNRGGTHAQHFELETDELYVLPNNNVQEVVAEINDFWKKSDKFIANKVKHKRGVLLYGPPGTGKSSEINLLTKALIKENGLVFYINNYNELLWYITFAHEHLRIAEKTRNVIVVIEDIDKFMDGGNSESTLLNFLDGIDSVNHQVVIATTNRYHELNDLLLRPSRFDSQIEINKPTIEVRKAYLLNKGLDEEIAIKWSKETDDFSIAELKELFIAVMLLDLDYTKTKTKINDQASLVSNTTFTKPKGKMKAVGFGMSK